MKATGDSSTNDISAHESIGDSRTHDSSAHESIGDSSTNDISAHESIADSRTHDSSAHESTGDSSTNDSSAYENIIKSMPVLFESATTLGNMLFYKISRISDMKKSIELNIANADLLVDVKTQAQL